MTKKLVTFQAAAEEISSWDVAAKLARKSRSAWMRDVLNTAASVPVFVPPAVVPVEPSKVIETAVALKERAVEIANRPKTKCEKRLPKGTFCKTCGRIH